MVDFRDIQHGVNDPVDGVDVKRRFNDNQTPHERAQSAADVRSSAIPAPDEEFLPEALRRRPDGSAQSTDRSSSGSVGTIYPARNLRRQGSRINRHAP